MFRFRKRSRNDETLDRVVMISFLASLVYGTPCVSRDDPGISQHGFLLKPVAASAERRLAHH